MKRHGYLCDNEYGTTPSSISHPTIQHYKQQPSEQLQNDLITKFSTKINSSPENKIKQDSLFNPNVPSELSLACYKSQTLYDYSLIAGKAARKVHYQS